MARSRTVAALAIEADLDFDEALVALWDQGIDSPIRADDQIAVRDLDRARIALGLASKDELTSIRYWANRLDRSESQIRSVLRESGLTVSESASRIPKGGVGFMRRIATSEGFSHLRHTETAPTRAEPPDLNWRMIGKQREPLLLSEGDVESIHEQLFKDYKGTADPIDTPGVRSHDLLSSACARPATSLGAHRKYPTAEMATAALAHSIVNNHPFHNGNKRTALVSMLVLLDAYGLTLTCSDDDLFRFILRVAQHRLVPREWPDRPDREVLEMASWLRENTRSVQRGERPIKWHRLRRILAEHNCICEKAKNVGNRMNIYRDVAEKKRFGRVATTKRLHVQVQYGDDGREVERNTLKHIRQSLLLDEEHGIDSAVFYEGEETTAGDFILRYRRILGRLARL